MEDEQGSWPSVEVKASRRLRGFQTALNILADLIEFLHRELGADMTIGEARVLMELVRADAGGVRTEMRDIALTVDMDRRIVSRHIAALMSRTSARRSTAALVEQCAPTSADQRAKGVQLTPNGVEFACRAAQQMRNLVLAHRPRVMEFIGERVANEVSEGRYRYGVDAVAGITVIAVLSDYGATTSRHLLTAMMLQADYRMHYPEIVDLSQAKSYALDKEAVIEGIEWVKNIPALGHRRLYFVAPSDDVYRRGKAVEEQFRAAGVPVLSFHRSVGEVKELVGLASNWAYPPLRSLTLAPNSAD